MRMPIAALFPRRARWILLAFVAVILSGVAPHHAGVANGAVRVSVDDDYLTSDEEETLRRHKKTLKGSSTSDKVSALEHLADMNERKSVPSRRISLVIASGLKDKDADVAQRAAELLPKQDREVAIQKLCEGLRKLQSKHRGVYRKYLKNVEKFVKLFTVDTSENLGQNIDRLNRLWDQFNEVSGKLYVKVVDARRVNVAIIDGMIQLPHENCYTTVKEYYRNVSNYSFRDSIPCVVALLSFGVRPGVEKIIEDFEKYYDYSDMQAYIEELEADRDPRSEDFVDWGEEYHQALVAMADARGIEGYPEFGRGVDEKWMKWWEKHREKFPFEIETEKK